MAHSDVLIIGGGAIGLALAREAAGRGLSVTLLERHVPGKEASWASAGMLAPQGELSEGPFLALCLASNRLYPAFRALLEEETGVRCYHREAGTFALAITEADEAELRHTYARQRADGLTVEWISGDEARRREPGLSTEVRGGLYLPNDRHVENRLLVPALEQACRQRGVTIVSGAQALRVIAADGRATGADTILGPFSAGVVVNAAGAWAASIGVEFGERGSDRSVRPTECRPPVFPVRGQMLALALPRPGFLSRVVRSPRSYLVPRHNGRLFVGATMEEVGFDKRNTVWGISRLLAGAQELFPELEGCAIEEMWAGLRPGSADNHPVLGETSLPGYLLATGLFRNGLLLTPIVAQTLADLITTGQTPELIAPFSINRFTAGPLVTGRLPGA